MSTSPEYNVETALEQINANIAAQSDLLKSVAKDLFVISSRIKNSTFDETAEVAQAFSRQGLSIQEVLKRTQDAMIMVRVAGVEALSAVESLSAAVSAYTDTTSNS